MQNFPANLNFLQIILDRYLILELGFPWHPYVLLTLLQRNFTAMGMLQLLLQALRAPHSILEAAAATTAEGSSTQAAAAPGGALRRHCGASPLPPRRRLPPGTGH